MHRQLIERMGRISLKTRREMLCEAHNRPKLTKKKKGRGRIQGYLLTAASVPEGAREVTENVAKAIFGEKEFRGKLRPGSRHLLGLLYSRLWSTSDRGVSRVVVVILVGRRGIWSGGRTVARPVAWTAALEATSGR